jgi:aryl-alcohol dehydrogenase-like predicted oxidoreductase
MNYRRFGRTGWQISEIGYGMWGMGSWTGSDDAESLGSLQRAVELGCNFFDTAWVYGDGHSERLLGQLVKQNPGVRLYTSTKVPPKNRQYPPRPETPLDETFPPDHLYDYTRRSLKNLGLERVDLLHLHVWQDAWAGDERWQRAAQRLKQQGLIGALAISVIRWQPTNVLQALRTGQVDAVQVVYNLFDQNPEDELFPLCRALDVGVIARVPFDEGSLTGALTRDTGWPAEDWRNNYFTPQNLAESIARVEALRADLPAGHDLPEVALRFILTNPDVGTTIPGMRKRAHVEANLAASERGPLDADLLRRLRAHRWQR